MPGELAAALLLPYVIAQPAGAMLGAWLSHAMFNMMVLQFSTKARAGTGQWIAEAVATAGSLLQILRANAGCVGRWWPATSARRGADGRVVPARPGSIQPA